MSCRQRHHRNYRCYPRSHLGSDRAVCRRVSFSMRRRPAAAVLRRPAAAPPAAVPAPVAAEQPGQFAWPHLLAWAKLLELGPETLTDSTGQYVYLVTLSRVLASTLDAAPHLCDPSGWSRQQVLDAVWDAMENPCVTTRGGRPRDAEQGGIILKEIVVRENTHRRELPLPRRAAPTHEAALSCREADTP